MLNINTVTISYYIIRYMLRIIIFDEPHFYVRLFGVLTYPKILGEL